MPAVVPIDIKKREEEVLKSPFFNHFSQLVQSAAVVSQIDIQKRDKELAERYPEYRKLSTQCAAYEVETTKDWSKIKRSTTSVPTPPPVVAYLNGKAGYVYLMEIDFRFRRWTRPFAYKIGKSINLDTRISSVSWEWGCEVNLLAYTFTQDAWLLEIAKQIKYLKYIINPLDMRQRKNDYFAFSKGVLPEIISDWEIHA